MGVIDNNNAVSQGAVATASSRALLTCGIVAGPIYVIVGVLQILMREGFDVTRHALSLMSNGTMGWIQIANFLVTGLLVVAAAWGMRRVLYPGRGCFWGPVLLGIYGLALMGAGIFNADPALGFPPGTPHGPPATISQHGLLHFVAGGIGFFGLIAACLVFAWRSVGLRQTGWAIYSAATGLLFFAAFAGIASGVNAPWIVIAFYLAVVMAWVWITALSVRLLRIISG